MLFQENGDSAYVAIVQGVIAYVLVIRWVAGPTFWWCLVSNYYRFALNLFGQWVCLGTAISMQVVNSSVIGVTVKQFEERCCDEENGVKATAIIDVK